MNIKCLLTGHIMDNFEILDERLGTYQWKCSRCSKITQRADSNTARIISMRKKDTMHRLAWNTLELMFPETFYKEPGKTKHILSCHADGSISFRLELMPHQIEQLRQRLYESDPDYSKWKFQPILRLVKD